MDIVVLPSLGDSATPAEALHLMTSSRRAGAVSRVGTQLRLYSAADACRGTTHPLGADIRLGDLKGGVQLPLLVPSLLEGVAGTTLSETDRHGLDRADRIARCMSGHLQELSPLGADHRELRGDSLLFSELNDLLDAAGTDIGVLGLQVGGVLVVSRHEGGVRAFARAPRVYRCANSRPHYFATDPGPVCPTGDGAAVKAW